MTWGVDADGRFIPLIPLGEEGDHDRDYQDADGVLRSTHRLACTRRSSALIRVYKLARNVKASEVLPSVGDHIEQILERKAKRRGRSKSSNEKS